MPNGPASRLTRAAAITLLLGACAAPAGAPGGGGEPAPPPSVPTRLEEPRSVVVQHVLIAHRDARVAGVTRTPAEAERLARTVVGRARRGESFDRLIRLYSDERGGMGTYELMNFGLPAAGAGQRERVGMVRGFGDVAFRLGPREIGLVPYDAVRSPFGWHIVKRLR